MHLACPDERPCYEYISQLRHDEFGIGVQLTPDVELLMKKQHDRQGRSLDRLSTGKQIGQGYTYSQVCFGDVTDFHDLKV